MKKALYVILTIVGVVALSIVSSLGYNYYEDQKLSDFREDTTATVEQQLAEVMNPVFMSVDDVYQFYERTVEEKSIDSTFMSIPPDVLINIAQVVIGRNGKATVRDIVYEFKQKYKTLYQYIKPIDAITSESQDTTAKNNIKENKKDPPAIRNVTDSITNK
jgi:hypothetical protein